MRKLILLLTCCLSLTMSAKVAYLLTGAVTDLASYQAAIPEEKENDKAQRPEYNAAAWFNTEFVTKETGVFMTVADFNDPNKRAGIDALWIYIDRVGIDSNNDVIADIDNDNKNKLGLNATFRANLADFVNKGGNLYVAKQATRLIGDLGLAKKNDETNIYPGFGNGGYRDAATWYVFTGFNNTHAYTGKVNTDHTFFTDATAREGSDRDKTSFELLYTNGGRITDNNCVIENGELQGDLASFETRNNCRVLGTWDNGQSDCQCAGFIEFYPNGDRKGTVVMMGLAAYQWTSNNMDGKGYGGENMKTITKNILNYLDKPVMTWSTLPGNGILFEEKSAVLNDVAGRTWTLSTDGTKAYTIGNNKVRYMAIADALPVTATAVGDGFSASKTEYSITRNVKVGRDNAESASLAYVLMNTNLNLLDSDEAGTYDPMYQSAEWFYNTYVSKGTGRFVTYEDIRDNGVPATVKTLWLHIDRKFIDAADFTSNYAKAELYGKLEDYVKAGGNLYLSGFATYLVSSMGRYATAPDNCGWTEGYTQNVDWHINLHCAGHMINGKTEGTENTKLFMAKGSNCTNRNCLWDSNKDVVNTDTYCKVLAGWGHAEGFLSAGMVEFYPKDNWKGTIIANGLAACQWGTCNSDENARKSLQGLTSRTLEYLGKTLSFDWITEPADGVISNTATVKINHVAGNAVEFQVLEPNADKASFGEITKTNEGDYATLTYNKAGEDITIKAFGRGDGLNIPKNQEYSKEETIKIVTPTVTWTVEPGDAAIAETKADAKAICDATSATVKYRSANSDQIAIDENTGALTFKDETPAEGIDITAYVTVDGQEYSVTRKTRCDAPRVEWVTEPATTGVVGLDMEYKAKVTYGDATIGYDYTNCSDVDGKLHFTKVGDATVRPYAYVNNKKYYTEEVPAVTIAVSPDLKWTTYPQSAFVGEQGKKAVASTNEGTIVYSSSDEERVTVDQEGNLTFLGYETAAKVTITATVTIDEKDYSISGELNANLPNVKWVTEPATTAYETQTMDIAAELEYWEKHAVGFETTNCSYNSETKKLTIGEGTTATVRPYVELTADNKKYYGATKTIEVTPVTFTWTHEPDEAYVGESKPKAQATCNVQGATVKYESSDPTIASIDETSGKITYLKEGTCNIFAFVEIDGQKYQSEPYELNVVPYSRENLTVGNYGTICLPCASSEFSGMILYTIEHIGEDGLYLAKVDGPMEAGMPYIFKATDSKISVSLTGDRAAAQTYKGLVGSFDKVEIGVSDASKTNYILSNNQLCKVVGSNVWVGANRAYISSASALTPERLNIIIGNPIATGVESQMNGEKATKALMGGRVVILRAGRMYDLNGRLLK